MDQSSQNCHLVNERHLFPSGELSIWIEQLKDGAAFVFGDIAKVFFITEDDVLLNFWAEIEEVLVLIVKLAAILKEFDKLKERKDHLISSTI